MSDSQLAEELSYLKRSLADLEEERQAGDISEAEYARLFSRYHERLRSLEAEAGPAGRGEPPPEQPRPSRRRSRRRLYPTSRRGRLVTGWSAFSSFLLAALFLSLGVAGVGPFSSPASLSTSERVQIMLAEASVLGSSGKVGLALSTYDKVLALRPHQPQALADGGWLSRLAGLSDHDPALVRQGDAEIEAAVRLAPGSATARAYDGVMLYADRREAQAAVREFDALLLDRPSRALLWSVHDEAAASYKAAGQPLPPAFARARPPAGGAAKS